MAASAAGFVTPSDAEVGRRITEVEAQLAARRGSLREGHRLRALAAELAVLTEVSLGRRTARLEAELSALAAAVVGQPIAVKVGEEAWTYSPALRQLRVPSSLLKIYSDAGIKGALCRELGRWLYSRDPLCREQPSHAFCLLWHGVDQVRTNRWVVARWLEALPLLETFYKESLTALERGERQPSHAESFVRNLIAWGMFERALWQSEPVRAALLRAMPFLPALWELPSGSEDAAANISESMATAAASRLFLGVLREIWPLYIELVGFDVATAIEGVPTDATPPEVPQDEPIWPQTHGNRGPLCYDPIGHRRLQVAQAQVRANLRCLARAEAPPRLEGESVGLYLVTWEQAMRRKALQAPAVAEPVDLGAQLRVMRQRAEAVRLAVAAAVDEDGYTQVCREEQPTIEALKIGIGAGTAQRQRRRKVGYFSTGTYDLRRGMQERLREQVTGVVEPRVFTRRVARPEMGEAAFVFCVDISGSMQGANMAAARRAFAVFQEALHDLNVVAGSLAYHGEAKLLNEIGRPDLQARRAAYAQLVAGGSNNEPQALGLAEKMFERAPTQTRVILFLTDGGAAKNTRECVQRLQAEAGIKIIGIGIGAACGEVTHVYDHHVVVPSIEALPDRLGELLGDLLQPSVV